MVYCVGTLPESGTNMVTCRYCTTEFKPKHKNHKICGSVDCKKSNQLERSALFAKRNPNADRDSSRRWRAAQKAKGIEPYEWPAKRALGLEIRALKEDTPCMDCGNNYPFECMDFDHRDPDTKHNNVGTMVTHGHNREKVMAEIAKCDIVCSNCHRTRTRKRRLAKGQTDDESGVYRMAEDDEAF